MEIQKELYHWLNARGVYINAPDWYFLDGTNKIGIGYREVNFSLPREQQMILNRQNIYDGLAEKTGSMSWGFVPLTKYQGGGPEAVLEPLAEHLKDYKQLMMQYYGAGVQACYRGPRLYDTDTTRKDGDGGHQVVQGAPGDPEFGYDRTAPGGWPGLGWVYSCEPGAGRTWIDHAV
jgi:hypothetical protein